MCLCGLIKISKPEYIIKLTKIIYLLSILRQSPVAFTTRDCFLLLYHLTTSLISFNTNMILLGKTIKTKYIINITTKTMNRLHYP